MTLLCLKKHASFTRSSTHSATALCLRQNVQRDKEGSLLTDGCEVIERWKHHFDKHLNGVKNEDTGDQSNGGPHGRTQKTEMTKLPGWGPFTSSNPKRLLVKIVSQLHWNRTATGGMEGRGIVPYSQEGGFPLITILNASKKVLFRSSSVFCHLKQMKSWVIIKPF